MRYVPCFFALQANYGDMLTLHILNFFARRMFSNLEFVHTNNPNAARVIGIGSIVGAVSPEFQGYVWTTGNALDKLSIHAKNAKVVAVRGKQTLKALNREKTNTVIFGDGGLLLHRVFDKPVLKRFKYGFIPHVAEHDIAQSCALMRCASVRFINLRDTVPAVTEAIKSCQYIISSSLHGLVVADAFEIPNFRVQISNRIIGGNYKYEDYYSAFSDTVPPTLVLTATHTDKDLDKWFATHKYERPNLKQIQADLWTATKAMVQTISDTS